MQAREVHAQRGGEEFFGDLAELADHCRQVGATYTCACECHIAKAQFHPIRRAHGQMQRDVDAHGELGLEGGMGICLSDWGVHVATLRDDVCACSGESDPPVLEAGPQVSHGQVLLSRV